MSDQKKAWIRRRLEAPNRNEHNTGRILMRSTENDLKNAFDRSSRQNPSDDSQQVLSKEEPKTENDIDSDMFSGVKNISHQARDREEWSKDAWLEATSPVKSGKERNSPSSHILGSIDDAVYKSEYPNRYISSSPRNSVSDSPNVTYVVGTGERKRFFTVGRVFITLWTESFAGPSRTTQRPDATFVSHFDHNAKARSKIKRFIVVRGVVGDNETTVTCLPVTSYDGASFQRSGIELGNHSFIYSKKPPAKVSGITLEPVQIELSANGVSFQDPSLVDYSKPYIVETNVKLTDVGLLSANFQLSFQHNCERGSESWLFHSEYISRGNSESFLNISRPTLGRSAVLPLRSHATRQAPDSSFSDNSAASDAAAIDLYGISGGSADVIQRGEPGPSLLGEYPNGLHGSTYRQYRFMQGSGAEQGEQSENMTSTTRSSKARSSLTHVYPPELDFDGPVPSSPARFPTRSRSSSVASVESLESKTYSESSASSLASHLNVEERLVAFLWKDEEIRKLCKDALSKVSQEKFTTNFSRCLDQFSAHLKSEASTKLVNRTARIIARRSKGVAATIYDSLKTLDFHVGLKTDDENTEDLPQPPNLQGPYGSGSESETEEADEFQDLEHILALSIAFSLFKENMRLFVHPDPVQRALLRIWPLNHSRTSAFEISYEVEWEVEQFLGTCFVEGQPLGAILTLTGDAINAQAQSCREYMTRTWPKLGGLILDGLENLLRYGKEARVNLENSDVTIAMKIPKGSPKPDFKSQATITVIATHQIHSQLGSALSWLCAAIRYSPHPHVVYSSISVQGNVSPSGKPSISLQPRDFEIFPAGMSCWHPLFPHAVVAKGFPIRHRKMGKGLEISFMSIAILSQCLTFVDFEGGLIVESLRTVLIPTELLSEDEDGDSLQWHLEYKVQQHSHGRGRISKILGPNHELKRHKEVDPSKLIEKRCFLGWAEEASVLFGTKEYPLDKILWSGTGKGTTTRFVKSHGVSMGTDGLSIFGVYGNYSWVPVAIPSFLSISTDKEVHNKLLDEKDTDILVYDTGSKTAWFLPFANVVLFLTHAIIKRRGYLVFDGSCQTELGFAQPSADGSSEASKVLLNCSDLNVRLIQSGRVLVEEPLRQTVKEVLQMLETVHTGLESAESEFERVGDAAPKFLHGVDFMDVMKMERCIGIREAKVEQPWAHFPRNHSLVLFCKGLGQPIVAVREDKLCRPWKTVPPKCNFLVATGKTVGHLLDRYNEGDQGSRLGEHVEWVHEQILIQTHRHEQDMPVVHVQRLRTAANARLERHIRRRIHAHERGCFIFSANKVHRPCRESIDGSAATFFDLPAAIIAPTAFQQKALPELPEYASDTSSDSQQSLSLEALAKTSASSNESQELDNKYRQSLKSGSTSMGDPSYETMNIETLSFSSSSVTGPQFMTSSSQNPSIDYSQKTLRRQGRKHELRSISLDQPGSSSRQLDDSGSITSRRTYSGPEKPPTEGRFKFKGKDKQCTL